MVIPLWTARTGYNTAASHRKISTEASEDRRTLCTLHAFATASGSPHVDWDCGTALLSLSPAGSVYLLDPALTRLLRALVTGVRLASRKVEFHGIQILVRNLAQQMGNAV
jgi:hypothetical protein